MPALILSSTRSPLARSSIVVQHDTASDFLSAAYPALRRFERSSNIILAHALQLVSTESALTAYRFTTDSDVQLPSIQISPHKSDTFWLTLWSPYSESHSEDPIPDVVLSCTSSTFGNHPIFMWTPYHTLATQASWLIPRMDSIAEHLSSCVPTDRVFSVFGFASLARAFANAWTDLTGMRVISKPFYAAYLTYCTLESFKTPPYPNHLPIGHFIRRAAFCDLHSVAQLCYEFAEDSVHYTLTLDSAFMEAHDLITKGQIWVYEASQEVATICAVTRSSLHVSAITKVYTTPRWRRRAFAESLVRYVTQKLFECGKESVVLYVGYNNSAQRVYHRVGFVGLCGDYAPDVEDSLELGFMDTSRGHW